MTGLVALAPLAGPPQDARWASTEGLARHSGFEWTPGTARLPVNAQLRLPWWHCNMYEACEF